MALPHRTAAVLVALLAALTVPAARTAPRPAAPRYLLTDLGAFAPGGSFASAVNDRGQVVGTFSRSARAPAEGFLWTDRNGNLTAEPGEFLSLGPGLLPSDVSASGYVAGTRSLPAGAPAPRSQAFRYTAGRTLLLRFPGRSTDPAAFAEAVNARGQVAGRAVTAPDGDVRAVLWSGRRVGTAGDLGGRLSAANGLDDAGHVVGWAETEEGRIRAFLWSDANGNGAAERGETDDLGTLGGSSSAAYDVIPAGAVVGTAEREDGAGRAFLWKDRNRSGAAEPGEMTDLGDLGGPNAVAFALNRREQVVGRAQTGLREPDGDPISRPFLWEDRNRSARSDPGEMTDLNALLPPGTGWVLEAANDINQRGQIAGWGTHRGRIRGFLLTPAPAPDLTVRWLRPHPGFATRPKGTRHAPHGEGPVVEDWYRLTRRQRPSTSSPSPSADGEGWPKTGVRPAVLEVRNRGARRSPRATLRVHLSHDSSLDPDDRMLRRARVPSLRPGERAFVLTLLRIPPAAGNHLIAVIDPQDRIAEQDETNNTARAGR